MFLLFKISQNFTPRLSSITPDNITFPSLAISNNYFNFDFLANKKKAITDIAKNTTTTFKRIVFVDENIEKLAF